MVFAYKNFSQKNRPEKLECVLSLNHKGSGEENVAMAEQKDFFSLKKNFSEVSGLRRRIFVEQSNQTIKTENNISHKKFLSSCKNILKILSSKYLEWFFIFW